MRTPSGGKPRAARLKLVPAPVGGLIANQNLAAPKKNAPQGASILENWFPTATGCQMRGGSVKYATIGEDLDTLTDVVSMFTYVNGGTSELFAADTTGIYDITIVADADAVPAAAVGSLTSGDWVFAQFATPGGVFLRGVNGADTPLLYDGSTWATTAITGSGLTAANLSYVWPFKSRLFFIEGGSLDAWYLPADTVSGAATVLPLGGVFPRGGSLLFGASWSLETNSGLVSSCIFVTTEGEVAVYSGTDPGSSSTWSLVGVYRIGRPLGKRAWIKAGGDVVIATDTGLIPLSQAVSRDFAVLAPGAVSYPIETEWNKEVEDRASGEWHCETWPTKQMVLVGMPTPSGSPARVFAANARTGAWSTFTAWAIKSLVVWGKRAFFGTSNGKIVEMDISGSDEGLPYTASFAPLFDDLGNPAALKTLGLARASYLAPARIEEKLSVSTEFNMTMPSPPSAATINEEGLWGSGIWGESLWSEARSKTMFREWRSVGGQGYAIAPAIQITSGALPAPAVDLVSLEYTYEIGDILT